ncbi:MAG TPA: hypothetical protein VD966_09045 [Pyrinomonadaceae bacterium]|nr:hypothetical protein [Pyrinomonadaceae bacterium]
MSEQINPRQAEEQETPASGLLLSVEPLQGGETYNAQQADRVDADTDMQDTSDEAVDADGTDESDTDGTDDEGMDADAVDDEGMDADGTDASGDADAIDA